eukprot:SAG25_NODE_137_length_14197_cov_30.387120_16_plen_54_part_00
MNAPVNFRSQAVGVDEQHVPEEHPRGDRDDDDDGALAGGAAAVIGRSSIVKKY